MKKILFTISVILVVLNIYLYIDNKQLIENESNKHQKTMHFSSNN